MRKSCHRLRGDHREESRRRPSGDGVWYECETPTGCPKTDVEERVEFRSLGSRGGARAADINLVREAWQ